MINETFGHDVVNQHQNQNLLNSFHLWRTLMAFNKNTGNNVNNNDAQGKDDSWKAQGFLNLYLPSKDGKERKLGAIPLRMSNANEAPLIKWLEEDPERVQVILNKLIMSYQSATPAEGTGFDLT
jgi:hypothetical protein